MTNIDMTNDEIVIYKTTDGVVKLDVLFSDETVWLTQEQMATLFQKAKSTINEHILNVYTEHELDEESTKRKIGNSDFSTKPTNYYNLDVIISVGYRVKSHQGTQFRQWATARLRDYIVKGFALNDERFKTGSSMNYFRELLERIREIRLSERIFYQQVKDIYATSIDYDANDTLTLEFFKEVQNKLLWAVSGKTAAELRYYRANHKLPMMGLTSTAKPGVVRLADTEYGKNFLAETELSNLKLIVEQYLAFAEAQALNHRPMYMRDWVEKLKLILTMNQFNILEHKGKISKALADSKTRKEYHAYKEVESERERIASLKELDKDLRALESLKQYSKDEMAK